MSDFKMVLPDMDDAALLKLVGCRIRAIRKDRDWTQQKLSDEVNANLSPAMVSRYEKGQKDMLLTTYIDLARALGVTPNDLVGLDTGTQQSFKGPCGYDLLSNENQKIVEKIIHAFLLDQETKRK